MSDILGVEVVVPWVLLSVSLGDGVPAALVLGRLPELVFLGVLGVLEFLEFRGFLGD